jgi:N-methylhydantoinase A
VLSAFGALVTPVRIDLARSQVRRLDLVSDSERESLLDEMREEGRRVLSAAGVAKEAVQFRYGVDARYQGQGNEITVWLGEGETFPVGTADVEAAFAADYKLVYGMTIPDVPVEVVTWRVSSVAPAPEVSLASRPLRTAGTLTAKGTRPVRFSRKEAPVETLIYRRDGLSVGDRLEGPAIVEERETTCVLRPGWVASVGEDGSLIAEREVSR